MDGYNVIIRGSGSAFDGACWLYSCDYDAEHDCLVSNGETALRYDYTYDENGESSETIVYEDGAARFTLDEDGCLLW